jgi:hypothetical protein
VFVLTEDEALLEMFKNLQQANELDSALLLHKPKSDYIIISEDDDINDFALQQQGVVEKIGFEKEAVWQNTKYYSTIGNNDLLTV